MSKKFDYMLSYARKIIKKYGEKSKRDRENVTTYAPSLSQNFVWLISFEILIARNYKFLHGITHFRTKLQSNCTALDQ